MIKEIQVDWIVTKIEDTKLMRIVELESEVGITIKAKCWRRLVKGLTLDLIGQKPILKLERYYAKNGKISYKILKLIKK